MPWTKEITTMIEECGEPMYMNIATGIVTTKDGWDYENESGDTVNAVDLGEVVEVELVEGGWVEV